MWYFPTIVNLVVCMQTLLIYCTSIAGKNNLSVVTIYTNLGESGVIHGLQETQAEVVITSHELLPKFKEILAANKDNVKTIVYMENPIKR